MSGSLLTTSSTFFLSFFPRLSLHHLTSPKTMELRVVGLLVAPLFPYDRYKAHIHQLNDERKRWHFFLKWVEDNVSFKTIPSPPGEEREVKCHNNQSQLLSEFDDTLEARFLFIWTITLHFLTVSSLFSRLWFLDVFCPFTFLLTVDLFFHWSYMCRICVVDNWIFRTICTFLHETTIA